MRKLGTGAMAVSILMTTAVAVEAVKDHGLPHPIASAFANVSVNVGSTASTGMTVSTDCTAWLTFRCQTPTAVEILADDVSARQAGALVTLVASEGELRRLLTHSTR